MNLIDLYVFILISLNIFICYSYLKEYFKNLQLKKNIKCFRKIIKEYETEAIKNINNICFTEKEFKQIRDEYLKNEYINIEIAEKKNTII